MKGFFKKVFHGVLWCFHGDFYPLKQEFTLIDFGDVYISTPHSFQDKIQKATKTK